MKKQVVEVSSLVRRFNGRKAVLDGISFSVLEGEFVSIFGKSGCGKTTLLNIIGGLDRPNSGTVLVNNRNLVELSEDELAKFRLRNIGFVFQDFNLLLDMTVRENIALPLAFGGKNDDRHVADLLKAFDIEDIAGEAANKISGGEAQRAAVARAMVNRPAIILADEPTGNLDDENTDRVIETLMVAKRDFGATIILATHDREIANRSSSTLFLSEGRAILQHR